MVTVEDIVRLHRQVGEILKRLENESLKIEQVREAFQQLITAPHADRNALISDLGIDSFVAIQFGIRGVRTTLDLTEIKEDDVIRVLLPGCKRYKGPNGRLMEAIDLFMELRQLLEVRGLRFKGAHHTRDELFELFGG
jgi:hypothetical protein